MEIDLNVSVPQGRDDEFSRPNLSISPVP